MSFIDELAKALKIGEIIPQGYRIEILGDKGIYLEGVKSLKFYDRDKVEICLKKGEIVVKGENLTILKRCGEDLAIGGKVKSVERK